MFFSILLLKAQKMEGNLRSFHLVFLVELESKKVAFSYSDLLKLDGEFKFSLIPEALPQASLLWPALGPMECLRTGLPRELVPHPERSVKMEKVNRALKSSHYALPSPAPSWRQALASCSFPQQYLAVRLTGQHWAMWLLFCNFLCACEGFIEEHLLSLSVSPTAPFLLCLSLLHPHGVIHAYPTRGFLQVQIQDDLRLKKTWKSPTAFESINRELTVQAMFGSCSLPHQAPLC